MRSVSQHRRGPLLDLAEHGLHVATGQLTPLDRANFGQDIAPKYLPLSLPVLSALLPLSLDPIGSDYLHRCGPPRRPRLARRVCTFGNAAQFCLGLLTGFDERQTIIFKPTILAEALALAIASGVGVHDKEALAPAVAHTHP